MLKIKIEFELEEASINDSGLPIERIREYLKSELEYMVQQSAQENEVEFFELWIELSDDGDDYDFSNYNVYTIKEIR